MRIVMCCLKNCSCISRKNPLSRSFFPQSSVAHCHPVSLVWSACSPSSTLFPACPALHPSSLRSPFVWIALCLLSTCSLCLVYPKPLLIPFPQSAYNPHSPFYKHFTCQCPIPMPLLFFVIFAWNYWMPSCSVPPENSRPNSTHVHILVCVN